MQTLPEKWMRALMKTKLLNKLFFRHINEEKFLALFLKLVNRETIVYVIFGVLTTLVNIAVFELFRHIFGEIGWVGSLASRLPPGKNYAYLDANAIAWVCAFLFAFFCNKLFVFESKSWNPRVAGKEFAGFFAARLFSLGVDQLSMFLLVSILFPFLYEKLGGNAVIGETVEKIFFAREGLSKLIVQVIIVVINYVFSKLFVFKKKTDSAQSK